MQDSKNALEDAVPLKNIDYECDNLVVLSVTLHSKLCGTTSIKKGSLVTSKRCS